MLITLTHINIKCLQLITELLTIETKGEKGYEALAVIFPTVEQHSMQFLSGESSAIPPHTIALTMYGYLILIK